LVTRMENNKSADKAGWGVGSLLAGLFNPVLRYELGEMTFCIQPAPKAGRWSR